MTFKQFNLDQRIEAGVDALGYKTPTPIQLQAIPVVMQGRDVMGLAQTGTGKTAAFVLPILQRLLDGPRGHVRALILSPTRELAEQTHEAITLLGKQTGLHSVSIYGGVSPYAQVAKIRRGVEIVVACPGRLLDHMNQRNISLAGLEVLVIDEADHMFDMGFLPDVRRILKQLPTQRQTLLFSATMPPDIRGLAQDILRNPATVQVGQSRPVDTVSHALYPVAQNLKTPLLMELLDHTDTESVLIFARTKHRAKQLARHLEDVGFSVTSLQGNLSQNRRQAALDGFRDGTYQIMVATDIAARGIDVSSVSHVINYDMPDTTDAYTHRIGRTGRAAKTGDAFTLYTDADSAMLRQIENILSAKIERRTIAGFDYGKNNQQIRSDEFARPPRVQQNSRRRPQEAPAAARPGSFQRPQQPAQSPQSARPVQPPRPQQRPQQSAGPAPRSQQSGPSGFGRQGQNASQSEQRDGRRPRSGARAVA